MSTPDNDLLPFYIPINKSSSRRRSVAVVGFSFIEVAVFLRNSFDVGSEERKRERKRNENENEKKTKEAKEKVQSDECRSDFGSPLPCRSTRSQFVCSTLVLSSAVSDLKSERNIPA